MLNTRHVRTGLALVLISSLTTSAQAKGPAFPDALDARVSMLFRYRNEHGKTLPLFRSSRTFEETGVAPLLVRFHTPLSREQRAKYERLGAQFGRALVSGAVRVLTSEEALFAMIRDGVVKHTSVNLPSPFLQVPLDGSRIETGVAASAAAYFRKHHAGLTGKDVIVGDLDTAMDPFHPAFFHPMAPVSWTDVNEDGELTPGTDGYDVNADGSIEDSEILQLFNGYAVSYFGVIDETDDEGFNPSWDYVYLDINADGDRNYGRDVDDAEDLAGMGEPLFGVEDLNADSVIAISERLVPLGSPKVKGIWSDGDEYIRGDNLAKFRPYSAGGYGPGHATGVLSIVGGGQPGVSRFLGLAPEADLLLADHQGEVMDGAEWLAENGADIIITEMGDWGTIPMDGSTEFEQLLNTLVTEEDIVVVSPAGNLGSSNKHADATIPPASAVAWQDNIVYSAAEPTFISFSITWMEGSVEIGGELSFPDGDAIGLNDGESFGTSPGGRNYAVLHDTTPRGAGYTIVQLNVANTGFEEATLTLNTKSDESVKATLFVMDDVSSWMGGASFEHGSAAGSMNWPALASNTLAVSAYALHDFGQPEAPGELRGFSGRGPDIWGDAGIDIAAPDNPISAAPLEQDGLTAEPGSFFYQEFGGTSGAGPHVAGVLALLKQNDPTLKGTLLRDALLEAARPDSGNPSEWGAGKLSVGLDAATGAPPVVTLLGPAAAPPETELTFTVSVEDDDPGEALVRWDYNYDGTWDTDFVSNLSTTVPMPDATWFDIKAEIMDAEGYLAASALRVSNGPFDPGTGGPAGEGGADGEGGSSSGSAADDLRAAEGDGDSGCGCRVVQADENARFTHAIALSLFLAGVARRVRSLRNGRDGVTAKQNV